MKKPTTEEVARRYYKRVQYRKRIESLIRRCKCSRAEDIEYGDFGMITYGGVPSCAQMYRWFKDEEREPSLTVDSYFGIQPLSKEKIDYNRRMSEFYLDRINESMWCVRCDRRRALKVLRRKALAAEAATKRALMNAVERSINGADTK